MWPALSKVTDLNRVMYRGFKATDTVFTTNAKYKTRGFDGLRVIDIDADWTSLQRLFDNTMKSKCVDSSFGFQVKSFEKEEFPHDATVILQPIVSQLLPEFADIITPNNTFLEFQRYHGRSTPVFGWHTDDEGPITSLDFGTDHVAVTIILYLANPGRMGHLDIEMPDKRHRTIKIDSKSILLFSDATPHKPQKLFLSDAECRELIVMHIAVPMTQWEASAIKLSDETKLLRYGF